MNIEWWIFLFILDICAIFLAMITIYVGYQSIRVMEQLIALREKRYLYELDEDYK